MFTFADIALPVPLDAVFTYRVGDHVPVVGGRVLVPFREKRLVGIVTELHDRDPLVGTKPIEIKPILQVLDQQPVLDCTLMELGKWIASYYIAPLGEVLRTMLPLGAEVRFARMYRITDQGLTALYESATKGSSLRSRVSQEEQMEEYAVLDYLSQRPDGIREQTLRTTIKCSRRTLDRMVAKKWIKRGRRFRRPRRQSNHIHGGTAQTSNGFIGKSHPFQQRGRMGHPKAAQAQLEPAAAARRARQQ